MIIYVFLVMMKIIKMLKNKKKQNLCIYKKKVTKYTMLSVNYISGFLEKDQKKNK